MEDEVLKYTIDKVNKAMVKLESLNIFGECFTEKGRKRCQGSVNKAYDELFNLKRYLEYIQEKEGDNDG